MIIDWLTVKAQQITLVQDAEMDELSDNFDFALSAEIMALLYAKNEAGSLINVTKSSSNTGVKLDEHELALA